MRSASCAVSTSIGRCTGEARQGAAPTSISSASDSARSTTSAASRGFRRRRQGAMLALRAVAGRTDRDGDARRRATRPAPRLRGLGGRRSAGGVSRSRRSRRPASISTACAAYRARRTRLAVILVDRASGERTVLGHRDPRLRLTAGRRARERASSGRAACSWMPTIPTCRCAAARAARAAGVPSWRTGRAGPGASIALLAVVDFPLVSRSFAEQLGWMERFGAASTVSSTRAPGWPSRRSAIAAAWRGSGDREIASPAFAIAPRDTTGAGDVFHAAFACGRPRRDLGADDSCASRTPQPLLRVAASGRRADLPTRAELDAFLLERRARPLARSGPRS